MNMLATIAWAQEAPADGGGGSTFWSFVPLIVIFVIFYVLLVLPQQKQRKQHRGVLEALKKGDKVVTSSGIWGTVTNLGKHAVTLQIADNAKIKIQREGIARLRAEDEE